MEKITANMGFWKFLAIIVVFFGGYVIYQNLVVLPNSRLEEQRLVEFRRQLERNEAQFEYDSCINRTWSTYLADWAKACNKSGENDDCSLVIYKADAVSERYENSKNLCLKIFQAKI